MTKEEIIREIAKGDIIEGDESPLGEDTIVVYPEMESHCLSLFVYYYSGKLQHSSYSWGASESQFVSLSSFLNLFEDVIDEGLGIEENIKLMRGKSIAKNLFYECYLNTCLDKLNAGFIDVRRIFHGLCRWYLEKKDDFSNEPVDDYKNRLEEIKAVSKEFVNFIKKNGVFTPNQDPNTRKYFTYKNFASTAFSIKHNPTL